MPDIGAHFRHRPPLPYGYRLVAVLTSLAAMVIGALFYHATSPNGATVASFVEQAVKPPTVRFCLGADLWCLFPASLYDAFGRPYPQFAVQSLESESLLTLPANPNSHELLLLAPAERFLTDEILRRGSSSVGLSVAPGPQLCQTHLALLMSTKTHDALMSSRKVPLSTLSDWRQACAATQAQPAPVQFTMADPDTCSASWLALADMVLDRFPTNDHSLAAVPDCQLGVALGEFRQQILVQGNSDRVEMYRFLLGGCPDNRVVLVYGHLADLISATGAFSGYAVVVPRLRFQPVVRAIVITRSEDRLNASSYLPSLLAQFQRAPPRDINPAPSSESGGSTTDSPSPDYATMARLLEVWDGRQLGANSP